MDEHTPLVIYIIIIIIIIVKCIVRKQKPSVKKIVIIHLSVILYLLYISTYTSSYLLCMRLQFTHRFEKSGTYLLGQEINS